MDDPSKIKFTIPQDINNMNKVNPQQNQFLMNNQFNFQNFQNNSPNLQNNIPNNINNPLPNNVQKFPNNLNINMCNPSNIDNLKNIMAQINNINPNQNNLFGKMFEPQKTQNFIPNIKNDLDFLLNQNKPNHENQNNNFLDNMFSENLFSDNQMNNLNNVNNQPSNLNINFDTNNNNNTNTNNICSPSNKINNNLISNFSIREIDYGSSLLLDNSLNYSFPIDYEEKIQIKEDPTYISKNSRYIKYHPIDQFLPSIPVDKKRKYKTRSAKTKKLIFIKKENNMLIDSDNDITDFTSYNNENDNNEILPILTIPRIKPIREEHTKIIKDKLEHEGINIYQTDNEILKKEEQNLYAGSFILYDEKNNVKVYVPCYRDNAKMKEFMRKKNLGVIEFQEDNDIDTDEEQLQLEIERNNEALINFMKKIEKDKDYVEKNLQRKKKE